MRCVRPEGLITAPPHKLSIVGGALPVERIGSLTFTVHSFTSSAWVNKGRLLNQQSIFDTYGPSIIDSHS